jgi:peptidyl-prolyl cis-trans isomerase D
MAVLSKIRQKSFLVITVIGLALFAFVIGALIENGGFNQSSNNAGTVNGIDIPFEEFRAKVDLAQKNQQGQNMSIMQASNAVWDQEVRNVLLGEECEKLGLRVGDDQLINVIKTDPQFSQNPQFLNEAGKFDVTKFNEFITSIKKSSPERWQQWLDYERQLLRSTTEQMFSTLLKAGYYTTEADAKFAYELEKNKVNFQYVSIPYSTIEDKKVTLTDDEVLDYMKKHEDRYKSEESREIEFVALEDKPSAEDEKVVKDKIEGLLKESVSYNTKSGKNDTLPGFKNTTNVIEFVNNNSDIKYDSSYVAKKDIPVEFVEVLYNLPQGQVYGPYKLGNYYALTRSLGKKSAVSAKASHILLSYKGAARSQATRTKEEALAKANELLAQINANPASFTMLAYVNSDDSSKQQGGDLGYFSKGQMTKKFEDFVFNNPVGKVGLVETEFGYHIINVTDKQDGVRLATIAQKIIPSEATSDALFTKATNFEIAANEKPFEQTAKEMKLTVSPVAKVFAFDENIQGIGSQREIVRWAFTAKKGDVKRFNTPAGEIIAKLKSINESGLLPIEDAKLAFGQKLMNEKKAKLIQEKMTGTTLDAVSKATGSPVKNAQDIVASNSFIPTIGQEPLVVGTAFGIKAGVVSKSIDGVSGVFKIDVKAVTKAISPTKEMLQELVTKLTSQTKNNTGGRVYQALKEKAKIEDNRSQFN